MIKYDSQDTTRTYYIIFDKCRGARMFWHWFTGSEYAHVYLVTELSNNKTLLITPTPSECLIDEWPCHIEQAIGLLSKDATSILRYTCKYNSLKLYVPRGIVSCVSVTKYFLGLRGWVLNLPTPRNLHKQLLKLGAQEYGKQEISTIRQPANV